MPTILRQLPFYTDPTTVTVARGELVTVRPFQLIVWVSIAPKGQVELSPSASRFPAILDIGLSHNFSLQQRHLETWARVAADSLPVLASVRVNRLRLPLLAGNV